MRYKVIKEMGIKNFERVMDVFLKDKKVEHIKYIIEGSITKGTRYTALIVYTDF